MAILFTMDVDPSFPWRTESLGLKYFVEKLLPQTPKNFRMVMNFSGIGIEQVKKIDKGIIDEIKKAVEDNKIELGNHTLNHFPLVEERITIPESLRKKILWNTFKSFLRICKWGEDGFSLIEAWKLYRIYSKRKILSPKEQENEIIRGCEKVEETFGIRPVIFRAPGLSCSRDILRILVSTGHKFDLSDWKLLEPQKIEFEEGFVYQIPINAKLDPEEWREDISVYKNSDGLESVITHPWEFSKYFDSKEIVVEKFLQMVNKNEFKTCEEVIKEFRL